MVRSGRWTRRMVPCRTGAPPPTIREFGAGAALVALPKTRTRGGARKGRLSARSGVRASVRSTSPTSGAGRDAPGRLIPAAGCENASSKEPRRRRLAARRHVATLLELIVPWGTSPPGKNSPGIFVGAWRHRRVRGGADGDAMTVTSDAVLRIDGMVCGSCTGAVSAALKGASGVVEGARRSLEPFWRDLVVFPRSVPSTSRADTDPPPHPHRHASIPPRLAVSVSLDEKRANVRFDPAVTSATALRDVVEDCGFDVTGVDASTSPGPDPAPRTPPAPSAPSLANLLEPTPRAFHPSPARCAPSAPRASARGPWRPSAPTMRDDRGPRRALRRRARSVRVGERTKSRHRRRHRRRRATREMRQRHGIQREARSRRLDANVAISAAGRMTNARATTTRANARLSSPARTSPTPRAMATSRVQVAISVTVRVP